MRQLRKQSPGRSHASVNHLSREKSFSKRRSATASTVSGVKSAIIKLMVDRNPKTREKRTLTTVIVPLNIAKNTSRLSTKNCRGRNQLLGRVRPDTLSIVKCKKENGRKKEI